MEIFLGLSLALALALEEVIESGRGITSRIKK
jgi:hypothetical protein